MTDKNRKINEINHGKKIAENAEKIWGHAKKAGQYRVVRRIELMLTLGRIDESSKVLELGCGTGEFTQYLAKSRAEVTGVDLSPELLSLAHKKLDNFQNVKLMEDDVEFLEKVPDYYFDNIVGNSVLHHVDYEKCFKACFRKLKSGGSIIFSEPNMINPQIALQKNIPWLKKMMGDSPDETAFFRRQVASLLERIGYSDVEVRNFDFMHPSLPDFLVDALKKPLNILENIPVIKEISGSLLIYAMKQ